MNGWWPFGKISNLNICAKRRHVSAPQRYTPFGERQQVGALRTLNCAGTAGQPELPNDAGIRSMQKSGKNHLAVGPKRWGFSVTNRMFWVPFFDPQPFWAGRSRAAWCLVYRPVEIISEKKYRDSHFSTKGFGFCVRFFLSPVFPLPGWFASFQETRPGMVWISHPPAASNSFRTPQRAGG